MKKERYTPEKRDITTKYQNKLWLDSDSKTNNKQQTNKQPSKELFKNILEYILANVNKTKRLDGIKELKSIFWIGTVAIKKTIF